MSRFDSIVEAAEEADRSAVPLKRLSAEEEFMVGVFAHVLAQPCQRTQYGKESCFVGSSGIDFNILSKEFTGKISNPCVVCWLKLTCADAQSEALRSLKKEQDKKSIENTKVKGKLLFRGRVTSCFEDSFEVNVFSNFDSYTATWRIPFSFIADAESLLINEGAFVDFFAEPKGELQVSVVNRERYHSDESFDLKAYALRMESAFGV